VGHPFAELGKPEGLLEVVNSAFVQHRLDNRIQAVLDEGAVDYLQKPFRLAELCKRVAHVLGARAGGLETGASAV